MRATGITIVFCLLGALKLFGSLAISSSYHMHSTTTSTMASPQGTIPSIYLDPSSRLLSLFDIYHIQDGKPYDWSGLHDKGSSRQIFILLLLLSDLFFETVINLSLIQCIPPGGKGNLFVQLVPSEFCLIFQCSKPRLLKKPITDLSIMKYWFLETLELTHSPECHVSTCVSDSSILSNIPHLLVSGRLEMLNLRRSWQDKRLAWRTSFLIYACSNCGRCCKARVFTGPSRTCVPSIAGRLATHTLSYLNFFAAIVISTRKS
jgi:hypothetical protein